MATFDAHKNFATSTVAVAPSSPTGGTSLSVFAGDGTKFPAVPFNVVIWPINTQPVSSNAEIARVTNISGDVFTITRNAEVGGTSRSVIVGDQISDNITAKLFTDIEALFPVGAVVGTTDAQVLTNKTITAPILSGTATGTYTLAGTPTITAPAISAPVLSGTATGTYTLAGTPTITAPAISAPVLSGTATGTYTLSGSPTINAHVISGDVTGTYNLKGSAGVFNVVLTSSVGTQNDFAPGLVGNTLLRCNNASLLTITGFAGGYTGQRLAIITVGAGQVDFVYNSAASAVGNKLITPLTVGNTSIAASLSWAEFIYDGSNRWMMLNHEQGGAISFTPVLQFGGANVGQTYTVQVGQYLVRGKLCFFWGRITFSAKGSSVGAATISSLPYVAFAGGLYGALSCPFYGNMAAITSPLSGYVAPGSQGVTMQMGGAANTGGVSDANFTNNSDVVFNGYYQLP